MCIVSNPRGDKFLEFIQAEEDMVPTFTPLTHALIVVKHQETFLLGFNREKQQWELPGGVLDEGESPRRCVIRECDEETSQHIEYPVYAGIMKFELQPTRWVPRTRIEYGVLYSAELTTVHAFQPNAEISQICFWDRISEIGRIDPIDMTLLSYYTTQPT